MARKPEDTRKLEQNQVKFFQTFYTQEGLPEEDVLEINIVPTPRGSALEEGELASPNFISGQKGWRINSDGDAEFQNVTITGVINNTENVLGDGSDGNVTISGTTTLSRDMYYNNLTVTGTLNTDGYMVFVKERISGAGTIQFGTPNNGSDGSGTTGGAGGTAIGGGDLVDIAGSAGGTGENGGVATAGGAGSASNPCIGSNGAAGGDGGDATGSPGEDGGNGGTATAPHRQFGSAIWKVLDMVDYDGAGNLTTLVGQAGSGGGGGGGALGGGAAGGGGGGAGASGGIVFIACNIWDGTFGIKAIGGNGGDGADGVVGGGDEAAGGGGGAGGNGGISVVCYGQKLWGGTYTLTAGTGGTAGNSNGGATAATNGSDGTAGTSYEFSL